MDLATGQVAEHREATPRGRSSGTHLCLLYENEEERREVIARFIELGIAGNERVAYFAETDPELIPSWLAEHGVQVPQAPQFTVSSTEEIYYPHGEFHVERMFPFWRAFLTEAEGLDLDGARATGETSWSREVPGGERIVEYEAKLNTLLLDLPVTALCQYDVHRFDGATILDILRVHPLMLIAGQVVANPYYVGHEQFLGQRKPVAE